MATNLGQMFRSKLTESAVPPPNKQMNGATGRLATLCNSAGVNAIEQLKRTADRFATEQESTRQAMQSYKEKVQRCENAISKLETELVSEKQQNAELRAKSRDDQRQIQYVMERMRVVQGLHEGLRESIAGMNSELTEVEGDRENLTQQLAEQDTMCKEMGNKFETVQGSVRQLQENLNEALAINGDLKGELAMTQQKLSAAAEQHGEEMRKMNALLDTLEKDKQQELTACKELQQALRTHHDKEEERQREHCHVVNALAGELQSSGEAVVALKGTLHDVEQHNSQLVDELKHAFNKHERDEEEIKSLRQALQSLQLSYNEKVKEAKELSQKLSILEADCTDKEQQMADLRNLVDGLKGELEQATTERLTVLQEQERLQAEVEVLGSREAELAEVLTNKSTQLLGMQKSKAALEEELVVTKSSCEEQVAGITQQLQEATSALKVVKGRVVEVESLMEQRVKEVQTGADLKVQRFAERTAQEMDEMKKKAKGDVDLACQKLMAEVAALQAEKAELQAVIVDATQEREKLEGQGREMEEQRKAAAQAAEEKLAAMCQKHLDEVVQLTARHEEKLKFIIQEMEGERSRLLHDLNEEHDKEKKEMHNQLVALNTEIREQRQCHVRELEALRRSLVEQFEMQRGAVEEKLEAELEKARQTELGWQEQLKAVQQQLEAREGQMTDAHNQLELVEVQLSEMRAKVQLAQAEVEKRDVQLKQMAAKLKPSVCASPATHTEATPAMSHPDITLAQHLVTPSEEQPTKESVLRPRALDQDFDHTIDPTPGSITAPSIRVTPAAAPPKFNVASKRKGHPPTWKTYADIQEESQELYASMHDDDLRDQGEQKKFKTAHPAASQPNPVLAQKPSRSRFSGMSVRSLSQHDMGAKGLQDNSYKQSKGGANRRRGTKAGRITMAEKMASASQAAPAPADVSAVTDLFGKVSANPYAF